MPAVGDQHKANSAATVNPFEEAPQRISEYTAQEIATLQSRLDKQLGPEYISSRPGAAGQKVHYLAAEKVINLANEVFGFNGWSSSIQNIQIDFVEENQGGRISLGLSVIVRVTLKDGTFHEDIGYGHIENCKGKAAAFEKAKKEGTTDALKRTLRTFGNVLGNCVYDKEFVTKVTKMKIVPMRWDAGNLHRHPDYAPVKKEIAQEEQHLKATEESYHEPMTEIEDDFGTADFDDVDFSETHIGHPDEVVLPANSHSDTKPKQTDYIPTNRKVQTPVGDSTASATAGAMTPSNLSSLILQKVSASPKVSNSAPTMFPNLAQRRQSLTSDSHPPQVTVSKPSASSHSQQGLNEVGNSSGESSQYSTEQPPNQQPLPPTPPQNIPSIGFYSARSANNVNTFSNSARSPVLQMQKFDPHTESPSIRKTAGIDHNRSAPIKRPLPGTNPTVAPAARERPQIPSGPSRDFVNPNTDMQRRIGAPIGGIHSPTTRSGFSGGTYRPPTRKGGVKRSALDDVSNIPSINAKGESDDIKKQRILGLENHASRNPVNEMR